MKLSIKAGSTSQTVNIFIRDSSSTTGAGLTGLAYNTASLTAYYALPKAAAVAITLATLAAVTSAWSSGGFKEIDATNMPGWYRFDIPDAALASGRFVSLHLKGAANMAPLPIEIQLTAVDNQSASAFITGVNSLAPPAAWNTDVVQTGDAYARIGANGAGLTVLASAANLATLTTYVDTEVSAILAIANKLDSALELDGSVYRFTINALEQGPSGSGSSPSAIADEVQTRTIAAVTTVNGLAANSVNAAALAADAVTELLAGMFTTAITESYRANGAAPTLAQALCEVLAHLGEASISGTTKTLKKFDHSTTAATFTLNDASAPTAITRAT